MPTLPNLQSKLENRNMPSQRTKEAYPTRFKNATEDSVRRNHRAEGKALHINRRRRHHHRQRHRERRTEHQPVKPHEAGFRASAGLQSLARAPQTHPLRHQRQRNETHRGVILIWQGAHEFFGIVTFVGKTQPRKGKNSTRRRTEWDSTTHMRR